MANDDKPSIELTESSTQCLSHENLQDAFDNLLEEFEKLVLNRIKKICFLPKQRVENENMIVLRNENETLTS